MARVTREALDAVKSTLKADLGSTNYKIRTNRDAINKLAKEQRTLKSKSGELWRLLRSVEDLPPRASTPGTQAPKGPGTHVRRAVSKLTDEQRLDLFSMYCRGCGRPDPTCKCQRDE
jgi:hypothetical protein